MEAMQERKAEPEKVMRVSVSVVERNEKVMLHFDEAVSWIELEPVQAIKVAEQMKTIAVSILRSAPKTA